MKHGPVALALALALAGTGFAAGGGEILEWKPLNEPGCGGWITGLAVSPADSNRVLIGGDLLGVGFSADGGDTWQSAFGFLSFEMADFTFNPGNSREVWTGSMSGPHVSMDGGKTWEPRRKGLPPVNDGCYSAPVEVVLFDPGTPRRLLAFGGSYRRYSSPGAPAWGAVWESKNGGASWTRLATVAGGTNLVSAAFSGDAFFAVADGKGVFRSADGGKSWQSASGGLPHKNVNWIAAHPSKPGVLWAALDNGAGEPGGNRKPGGIWKTADGGRTWKPSSRGLGSLASPDGNQTSRYSRVAVAPSNPNVLYTADTSYGGAGVYRSRDGGESWTKVYGYAHRQKYRTAYPSGPGLTVFAIGPKDTNQVYAAGSEYCIRSQDGGETWEDVTSAPTPGNTESWSGRGYSGLCAVNFAFNPERESHAVLLAMDDGKFWQSIDFMKSWRWGGDGLDHWGGGNDVTFSGRGGGVMYVTFGQFGSFAGIGKTGDGGKTWKVLAGAAHGLPEMGEANSSPRGIYAHPRDPEVAWAAVAGKLLYTDTGGERWRPVLPGPGISWIAADPKKPLRFYVVGADAIYATENGEDFNPIPGCPRGVTRIAVDPADGKVLYATPWRVEGGGLWKRAGGEWKLLRADPLIYDVAVSPAKSSRIAVITEDHPYHDACRATGVWLSDDGGETWSQQNRGLPVPRGEVIRFNPHKPEQIVVGTMGRGYFIATLK
jgi:photosystem II stability/assembly factor-like uncharacterized protein